MTPAIDIIIVNFNTRAELHDCLASLHAHPPACGARVTVVDNASTDGSVDDLRAQWPTVTTLALSRNVGFGAANNIALRATHAPYALLLNSDTIVPAGAIDTLLERLKASGAAAAGPRLVDASGRPEVSFGPMLNPASEFLQLIRQRLARSSSGIASALITRTLAKERPVDWVTGACLLVRRDAALAAGLFDERFFMYEEDVDFCAALRAAGGMILFTPHAEVTHLRGRSVGRAGASEPSHYDRSHLAFYEKHAPRWAAWLRAWLRVRGRRIR